MAATLYQWVGLAPREARVDHRVQVSCAAVFPSRAAFLRATGSPRSRMDWVSSSPVDPDRPHANEGAQLAIANPGVVYYQDDLRHPRKTAPWIVHPTPDQS